MRVTRFFQGKIKCYTNFELKELSELNIILILT